MRRGKVTHERAARPRGAERGRSRPRGGLGGPPGVGVVLGRRARPAPPRARPGRSASPCRWAPDEGLDGEPLRPTRPLLRARARARHGVFAHLHRAARAERPASGPGGDPRARRPASQRRPAARATHRTESELARRRPPAAATSAWAGARASAAVVAAKPRAARRGRRAPASRGPRARRSPGRRPRRARRPARTSPRASARHLAGLPGPAGEDAGRERRHGPEEGTLAA